jgi:uncharacterized protein YndB with AHSA1/START domain
MTESPNRTDVGDREVTVTRIFDAPLEAVWKAWTEPEQFAQWFGGPPYTTPPERVSLDVRPGGQWRATMVSDEDGSELPFAGEYREVVEQERLVLTFVDPGDPGNPNVEVLTVTFADLGDKTEVVAHQTGHLPPDEYAQLAEGYSSFFDQLAEHLSRR